MLNLIRRSKFFNAQLKEFDKSYPTKEEAEKAPKEQKVSHEENYDNVVPAGSGNSLTPNLVSSAVGNGKHAPVIDIDFPVYAVPSRTPGHTHLYIEKELTWAQYQKLLKCLAAVGIVEKGYVDVSIKKGQSFAKIESYQVLEEFLLEEDSPILATKDLDWHHFKELYPGTAKGSHYDLIWNTDHEYTGFKYSELKTLEQEAGTPD